MEASRPGRLLTRRSFALAMLPPLSALAGGSTSAAGGRKDLPARFPYADAHDRNKVGFIDASGVVRIPARYSQSLGFQEGLAAVKVGDLWGYIDLQGKWVVEPKYPWAVSFSDGMAEVELPDGRTAFIRRSGEVAFRVDPGCRVQLFSEGLVELFSPNDDPLGYLDKEGRPAIRQAFRATTEFSEGLAAVSLPDLPRNTSFAFIDSQGTLVVPPRFTWAGTFSEGLAPVNFGGKVGYVDRSGAWVVPPRFDYGQRFKDGLAAVMVYFGRNPRWGYIDRTGAWKTPPLLREAYRHNDGRAPVVFEEGYGYLDEHGKACIPPGRFVRAEGFRNGLARVRLPSFDPDEHCYAYIDRDGKSIFRWVETKSES